MRRSYELFGISEALQIKLREPREHLNSSAIVFPSPRKVVANKLVLNGSDNQVYNVC